MALCCKLKTVLQAYYRMGHCRLSAIRSFSVLSSVQARPEIRLDNSKFTCLVRTPHIRHEVTFAKKRRKLTPQHQKDGVDPNWACVFYNNMNRYHFWGQLVVNALAIPVFGMCAQVLRVSWLAQDFSITGGFITSSCYVFLYSILFVGVNSLCKRNIKRIYTDESANNYAAVVQDYKMMNKTITFNLKDSKRLPPSQVLGNFWGNVAIKGRPYLLTPTDFVQPKYYNLIMGYDLGRSVYLDVIKDIDIRDLRPKQVEDDAKTTKKSSKR